MRHGSAKMVFSYRIVRHGTRSRATNGSSAGHIGDQSLFTSSDGSSAVGDLEPLLRPPPAEPYEPGSWARRQSTSYRAVPWHLPTANLDPGA